MKIAMNGAPKHIGIGLINNYRKLHGLPLRRKKNKKKRCYILYPRCEFYTSIMHLCENCGKPLAEVREDIYFHPCLCDTCYIEVKGEIYDRDAIEEN